METSQDATVSALAIPDHKESQYVITRRFSAAVKCYAAWGAFTGGGTAAQLRVGQSTNTTATLALGFRWRLWRLLLNRHPACVTALAAGIQGKTCSLEAPRALCILTRVSVGFCWSWLYETNRR